jgi:hypothetical protein
VANKPTWWFGLALAAATQSLMSRPEQARQAIGQLTDLLPGISTGRLPGLAIKNEFLDRLKQALHDAGLPQ